MEDIRKNEPILYAANGFHITSTRAATVRWFDVSERERWNGWKLIVAAVEDKF